MACPDCEKLREERDAALLMAARERERADVLLIAQSRPVAPPPPKPIRYQAVDALNEALKKALPLPHKLVRAIFLKGQR